MAVSQRNVWDPVGFITGDKIESWARSQNKVSVTAVISVDHKLQCKIQSKGMKKISIGIDFSKQTFDATILCRDNDCFIERAYGKFENDLKGFRSFEKWVRASLKGTPGGSDKYSWLFCGEHTGMYSIALCDYLTKKRYFMWLESALVIHRKCGIIREKNDRVDSRRIAEYALRNYSEDVRPYELDSSELRKLKSLFTAHTMLTKDKVSKTNQLKSGILDASPLARKEIERQLYSISRSLREIDSQIEKLLTGCNEFARNYEILNSFKGVGLMTIACLIIKTRNFRDMSDSRELGCYIGVVPHGCQSGISVNKAARTSRYRDKQTNALLTNCVTSAIMNHNPIIRPYYDRLIARGIHPNKAKNNCKFKIINVLMAMIRNDRPFSMDIHGKSRQEWMKIEENRSVV